MEYIMAISREFSKHILLKHWEQSIWILLLQQISEKSLRIIDSRNIIEILKVPK